MAHPAQQEYCLSVKEKFPEYFKNKKVLDVGSLNINGDNKYLFEDCDYAGLDIITGRNVDIVSIAHEFEASEETYDVIISTEAFEHDMYLEKTLANIVRMLKGGGLFLFTCATSGRGEHGTAKHDSVASPTSQVPGWCDYYKNLIEENIRELLDVDNIFRDYEFNTLWVDLRFWGIKK